MKKQLLLALCASYFPFAQADLIITSVFDGPLKGGLPKGVELYTNSDIEDLSRYSLGSANNGGGSDGEEFIFPATRLSAGRFLHITSDSEGFERYTGLTPDYVDYALNINGDDAIELFKDGSVIDTYGDINSDGTGSVWEYADSWAYRLTGPSSATFDSSQWQFAQPNALDGSLTNATANTPIPLKRFNSDALPPKDGGDDGGNDDSDDSGNGDSDTQQPIAVFISDIQGNPSTYITNRFGESDASPLIDQVVTIEAIVVGDFQNTDSDITRNLGGFYVQEEDTDQDNNPESSEGLFIADKDLGYDVALGDKVTITGTVAQYFGETQLNKITHIDIIATDALAETSPVTLQLSAQTEASLDQAGKYQPNLEAFEGMWIVFEQALTISEQFQLDRFNEIKLVAGERPQQFSQMHTPNAEQYSDYQKAMGTMRITYDDGLNTYNANINNLDGFAPYTENSAPRLGDFITGLTGILDYKWAGNSTSPATWRVRANQESRNVFTRSQLNTVAFDSPNPRPLTPTLPQGNFTVASLNVLNFFTTLDNGNTKTAIGFSPRGADDLTSKNITPATAELERQQQKLINAISLMDAHVLGIIEIENHFDAVNDDSTAIEVLVNALNLRAGEDRYDYVYPNSEFVGGDAIAVAFIYQPRHVTITAGTTPAILDDNIAMQLPSFLDHDFALNPLFNGPGTSRASLAVSFTHKQSQQVITLTANHFKSKGSSGLSDENSPNFDQKDGAGFWNNRRLQAAIAVNEWLANNPTHLPSIATPSTTIPSATTHNSATTPSAQPHHIVLGDLNAYAMEQPVQYLLNNGFNNVEDNSAYSYVYDGQIGTLDYLLINDSLLPSFNQAQVWHINADEADALDYNLDYAKSAEYFNANTATRYSDHDPVIAGFTLSSTLTYAPLKPSITQAAAQHLLKGHGLFKLWQKVNFFYFTQLATHADWLANRQPHKACKILNKIASLSDGFHKPFDLIKGSATASINAQAKNNMLALNCY